MLARLAIGLSALLWMTAAQAQQADPMKSEMWETIRAEHLGGGTIAFDDSIRLMMPERVETAFSVPMVAKFVGDLHDVEEFVVIAENNPIQGVIRMTPYRPIESVGLDMRLEQSTPVRAAARTPDGVWHVASTFVTVMTQGGCSTPNPEGGASELGAIAAKTFDRVGGASRLKFKINHPMDTGFATQDDGTPIPAYYIESMTITDDHGPVADLHTSAAMASDPTIILDLPERQQSVKIDARDSKGLLFEFTSNPPTM